MGTSTRYRFLSPEDEARIKQAIADAEKNTSGEIHVHIENFCPGNVLDRAAYVFEKLGMHKTRLRNGVLIYVAVKDHKLAILGDAGINAVVSEDFWESLKNRMTEHFRQGHYAEGLIHAIQETGMHLKQYFPHQKDDVNELSDEITFENN